MESLEKLVQGVENEMREKANALKARELAFEKKLAAWSKANPAAGTDSDVLELNVGGVKNIAVLRSTLTQFEYSMLAARYCGRWDEDLPRDRHGNIFIDCDPESFNTLLSFLRKTALSKRTGVKVNPPKPTYDFCSLLDYYKMMEAVYPQRWTTTYGTVNAEEKSDGSTILTAENFGVTWMHCPKYSGLKVKAWKAVLEMPSTSAQIGWVKINPSSNKIGTNSNQKGIDIPGKQFLSEGSTVKKVEINGTGKTVVKCSIVDGTKYTISVQGCKEENYTFAYSKDMYPAMSFVGSVTVSEVEFDYSALEYSKNS